MFMKRMRKSLVPLLTVAALAAGRLPAAEPAPTNAAAAAVKSPELFEDRVVAKAKGFEIKRSQLDLDVIRAKSQVAASGRTLPPDQAAQLERQLLDQLITIKLLEAKATEADRAEGKATAEKRFTEAKTRLGSEEALKRQLKLMGISQEEMLAKWTESLTAEAVIKRELKINVTDAEARKFYDDNPSRFENPEMVRASHILLTTRDASSGTELSDERKAAKHKQMEDLLKRARAGEDFAKLAQEFSEDPGSKDKGGEYKFPRGQMVPEFEAAAFSLQTNQVSDIVTTSFGYHIIKVNEKIPARKEEYATVAANIKDDLARQAMQKELPGYIQKLKKEADVEILDEKLKLAEPSEVPATTPASPLGPPGKKPDAK
jgi:peptidyl-prolyl cis-trans isomerase C